MAAIVLGLLAVFLLGHDETPVGEARPIPTTTVGRSPLPSGTPEPTTASISPAATANSPDAPDAELQVVMQAGTDDTIQYVVGFGHGLAGRVAAVNVYGYATVPATAPYVGDGAIYLERGDGSWDLVDTGSTFQGVELTALFTPVDRPMVLYGLAQDLEPRPDITGVWTSTDGVTWTQAEVAPAPGMIAAGPLGYVLATITSTDPEAPIIEIYRSDDAMGWELVHTVSASRYASVEDVAGGPEGFVVAARRGPDQAPLILASGDGRSWIEAPAQSGLTDDDLLMEVAPIGPDWVAAGWRATSGPARGVDLWSSADGLHWNPGGSIEPDADLEAMGSRVMYPSHLISAGGTLMLSGALAAEGSATRPIGVWTSTDGSGWEPLDLGGMAEVRAADGAECCFWLGGRLGSDSGEAVIWRWDPSVQ